MKKLRITILFLAVLIALTGAVFSQAKKRNTKKPAPTPKPTETIDSKKTEIPAEDGSAPTNLTKKNERAMDKTEKNNVSSTIDAPVYFYEFTQPNFTISELSIEHDGTGKGKITFLKQSFSEPITEPIQVSTDALERIKNVLNTLDFLNSNEDYQYAKDYSHLGTIKFTVKKDGRMRTATFNWTENKDAKTLADEYRKIGNQFIWMFDFSVARENQQLETPRLMDAIDSLIKRNEISDAAQMIPFFKGLTDDERVPLITRNHAARLINQIEKQVAKLKKDK